MEGLDIFDPYEIRARIFPSILVLSPMVILLFSIIPLSDVIWKILIELGIFLILVYGFSYPVRLLGVKYQDDIWKITGAPSTIILRWNDATFGLELKQQLYSAITKEYSIDIPKSDEQEKSPNQFDKIIADVFSRVRSDLRKMDKEKNLWSSQNAEYGFARNLIGSRAVLLILSIICTGVGLFFYVVDPSSIRLFAVCINAAVCLISLIGGWYLLPIFFDYTGHEYAKSAWMAFLSFSKKN
jgi:hypothetical protein